MESKAHPVPANSDANEAAVALLRFIQSLPGRKTKCVLSGQFIRWNQNASLDEITSVHAKTGHWLSIAAGDYYTNNQKEAQPICYRLTNDVLMEYASRGGIISLSVHMNNPATGGPAWDPAINLAELLDEKTAAHADFMRQLTEIGNGLQELKEAGFVVVFRPFHEMSGGWFWWGGKEPEHFHALWQKTFHYLSRERQLDNLLWAFSSAAGINGVKYYPGDEYVDIVGFDAYGRALSNLKGHYADLLSTGKPFGFAEYGPHSQPDPDLTYDWAEFGRVLAEEFPQACYFMAWRDHWGLDQNTNPGGLLNDPRMINLDDLIRMREAPGA